MTTLTIGVAFVLIIALGAMISTLLGHPIGFRVDHRLKEPAERRGLSVRRTLIGGRAVGQLDGMEVEVDFVDQQQGPDGGSQEWGPVQARCEVRVRFSQPMPAGQRLYSMNAGQHLIEAVGGQDLKVGITKLDQALRIVTDDPISTTALLTSPVVADLLTRAANRIDGDLVVTETELRFRCEGRAVTEAGPVIDQAMALASALQGEAWAAWRALAASLDLDFRQPGGGGGTVIEGQLGDVRVRVRLDPGEARGTTIDGLIEGFPELRIRPRQRGEALPVGAVPTQNPVLDMALVLRTLDPDSARAVLADPELTGPLMELFHGHGGARVHPGGVGLVLEGWDVAGVETYLPQVVLLAHRLQLAAGRLGDPSL